MMMVVIIIIITIIVIIANSWIHLTWLTKPSRDLIWTQSYCLRGFVTSFQAILPMLSIQKEAIPQKLICAFANASVCVCAHVCHHRHHHHPPVISTGLTLAVSQFNYIGTGRWAVPSMYTIYTVPSMYIVYTVPSINTIYSAQHVYCKLYTVQCQAFVLYNTGCKSTTTNNMAARHWSAYNVYNTTTQAKAQQHSIAQHATTTYLWSEWSVLVSSVLPVLPERHRKANHTAKAQQHSIAHPKVYTSTSIALPSMRPPLAS